MRCPIAVKQKGAKSNSEALANLMPQAARASDAGLPLRARFPACENVTVTGRPGSRVAGFWGHLRKPGMT